MLIHEMFLDVLNPQIVHCSPLCDANSGLTDILESHLNVSITDLDQLVDGASRLGYVIPTWSARTLTPCQHCTLVVTANWAMAA
jgi:hypothetical protein